MPNSSNSVRIFIDESGTPEKFILGKNQEHDKYFTLACVVIKQAEYKIFKEKIGLICRLYEKNLLNKEIKSNYIRCSNPKFLRNGYTPPYVFGKNKKGQKIYDEFCAQIRKLLSETKFEIISVTINKERAQNKFPHIDHHRTMLCDLWERLSIYFLMNKKPKMKIVFDRTKGYADTILKETYALFKKNGSWYWDGSRLNTLKLDKDIYSCSSEDSRGIQLVDLCAYPIKKHLENGNHAFFKEVIKSKLHRNVRDKKTGKVVNMGTKKCLS